MSAGPARADGARADGARADGARADGARADGGREGEERDAKGRFQPGRSGNPAGRQRGSRNRATLLRERLNAAQEAAVINKAFDNLLTAIGDGRLGASIVLLDALAPKPRGRAIDLDLPDDALPEDILDKAMWDMARGIITLDEALGIARYVKERQALQQQEYVSRRARARIARREAEEAALAAAEAAAAEAAPPPAAPDPVAPQGPATVTPPRATGSPGGDGATAAESAPGPVSRQAGRPGPGVDPGPVPGSRPADDLQNQARDPRTARHRRRAAPPDPAADPAPRLPAAA